MAQRESEVEILPGLRTSIWGYERVGTVFGAFGLAAVVAVLCGSSGAFQAESRLSSPASAPDIPVLLAEVKKNQKALDSLVEQYACRKNVEELQPARNGGFRRRSVKEYEVFYLGGEEVDRLVAKDGKPLPLDEQQEETARAEKKIRDFQRRQEKRARREARGERKEEEPGISDFLRVDRFTNPRHVEFRGRSVVAFDFEANPDYRPKTRLESLLQKVVGTAWVDDQAKEIVKLEACFGDSFKIGGGLVAAVREGSAFLFEQGVINNEVWLPSYVEIHVRARLLFKGLRLDQIIQYSDYKKFRVEAATKAAHGKGRATYPRPKLGGPLSHGWKLSDGPTRTTIRVMSSYPLSFIGQG